ncbi:MAG: segregation ATPase FtsK/SpoIIIE, family [Frankiaceae bacterium]|nr:segregation ATPase FtsK/SpoIIIE, family [Frankiaceae bacterium]
MRVEASDTPARDVAVECSPENTVEQLLGALREHLRLDLATAAITRTGERLSPRATLQDAGLRSGDTLRPRVTPVRGGPAHRLVVAGGVDVGQSADLDTSTGEVTIGRGNRAGLRVHDSTVSSLHARLRRTPDGYTVEDLGSSNGTFVNGVPVTGAVAVEVGDLVEVGDVALRIAAAPMPPPPIPLSEGRLQFTRGPRVSRANATTVFEVPAPPEEPTKRRFALSTALVPLAIAPVMALITHQISYLAMAALSPLIAVASVVEDRRHGSKDHGKKVDAFRRAVDSASTSMAESVQDETVARWLAFPDPADIVRRTTGPAADLWERRLADPDALALRVGWGDLPASARWAMREGGEQQLRDEAAGALGQHGVVRSAPATVTLKTTPVVGVSGSTDDVDETARWLVAQAAALHSPRELSVVVAVGDARADAWEWAAWLPHCREADAPEGSMATVAVGGAEAIAAVGALNDLVSQRIRQRDDRSAAKAPSAAVLAVIDHRAGVPAPLVTDLLERGPGAGVHVIWLGESRTSLPGETSAIVDIRERTVSVTTVAGGAGVSEAMRDRCPPELAADVARALAGVRDASARNAVRGDLPAAVSLSTVLGGIDVDRIVTAWTRDHRKLDAPLGLGEHGVFSVDLRHDGPHGLLGGTTGAGKSELLQTLIASLAARHPPTRLTFLLVDYKGGAAFKDCVHLPHVVGFVTDLGGALVNRALVSLGAEVHRRERLLAEAGAKDLLDMERIAPDRAPASLLVVVDEFATLAKELPEFVDGVVNIAQRGRSLGVHLILATQRPAGVVNDNIRANTNMRIALRMNDETDSRDVVGVPDAARLPRSIPGRAYVRTGAGELALVQVAFAGATDAPSAEASTIVVADIERGRVVHRDRTITTAAPAASGSTDLERVVAASVAGADKLALPAPVTPWLPPLPDLVRLDDLDGAGIGLVDVPAQQRQVPYAVNLQTDGNLLVLGASGAGKTTLLRTLAVSLARQHSPADLHLYALDFASRGLRTLAALPHCGAVVAGDDVDRIARMFTTLRRWIEERRRRFAETGATSVDEYARLNAHAAPMPRVVVMLDGYSGFASAFEKVEHGALIDELPRLVGDGHAVGVHFVITANRRNALPPSLAALISTSIVFRLADADDYSAAGLDARLLKGATLPPGRGYQAGTTTELQCAVVGIDASGDAQQAAVSAIAADLVARWPGQQAPPVATLPDTVPRRDVAGLSRSLRPVVGIGERELAPVAIDLEEAHFFVAGPIRSGKSAALAALALGLREADPDLRLVLLAPRRSPLTSLTIWSALARTDDDITALCEQLEQTASDSTAEPTVVVLDDGQELLDSAASGSLEMMARRGRDTTLRLVAACDITAALRAYGGWVGELKKDRHGLLLQPDADNDGDLFGLRLPQLRTNPPGRGYLVTRFGAEPVQVAQS